MLEHKTPKVRFREAKCEEKCDGRQLLKETEFPDVGDKEAWIENMLTSRYIDLRNVYKGELINQ